MCKELFTFKQEQPWETPTPLTYEEREAIMQVQTLKHLTGEISSEEFLEAMSTYGSRIDFQELARIHRGEL